MTIGRTFTAVYFLPEPTQRITPSDTPKKLYRNPVFVAEEWRKRMQIRGFTQAELARELGVTRARVTQVLNVLKLPEDVLANVKAEGDPMPAPVFTERMLRTRG